MVILASFDRHHRELGQLGIKLDRPPGEFTVRYAWTSGQPEAFERLEDAVLRGHEMARERPKPPAVPRRRGARFLLLPPKARLRAAIKAHNWRLRQRQIVAAKAPEKTR